MSEREFPGDCPDLCNTPSSGRHENRLRHAKPADVSAGDSASKIDDNQSIPSNSGEITS